MCEKSGVHTKFIPDYNKIIPTKPYTEDILGLPVINIRYVPLSNTFNAMVKRVMDIFGSIVAIIVSSPVMLLMCILIKLTSPGPLIYKQERVGLHNKTFPYVQVPFYGDTAGGRREARHGQSKMIRELPGSVNLCGEPVLMSFHSFLIC